MDELITTFYTAFKNQDAEAMINCYHDQIVFEDPAFGILEGDRAKNMWRMLLDSQKNTDFTLEFSHVNANDTKGTAKWEAFYVFRKTGRKVHNLVDASFEFKDGKIIKHTDNFNLREWAKQAIGLKGYMIGGTSYFKTKLQFQTDKLLSDFENKS